MTRLLNLFRSCPTAANRTKLQAYLNRHMMAMCMATTEEVTFLRTNQFTGV